MNILFLHQNFPAQFRHLATVLGQSPEHQVVFGTTRQEGMIPGVHKALYRPDRLPHPQVHHYVQPLERAVLEGQAVYRLGQALRNQGFIPDRIYAHSGWGPGLFMRDLFPNAQYLCFFEWFYHARGSDSDFDPEDPLDANTVCRIRVKNAPILLDLYTCDRGLSPTPWQRQQFPPEFQSKISVCHDGIDTEYFQPKPGASLVITPPNPIASPVVLNLSNISEIVTYVARGMEPYRGFPNFMKAVALLQKYRPQVHAVVVGEDRVAYGRPLPNGKTFYQQMIETLPLDLQRIHFVGGLPYNLYLQVLQASSVHVYLTYPFVLSWSMLEAMSTGCVVVGSRTAPVEEVITDGVNGFLVDFFSPEAIVERIMAVLDDGDRCANIRQQARQTILDRYALHNLLPQHLKWLLSED